MRRRRVTVELGSARVKAIVRDEVERREKILRRVTRGEEFEDARIYVRGCRRDVWYGRRRDSAPSRRTCKRRGACNILTRPRCGRMRSQPGNTLSLTAKVKV